MKTEGQTRHKLKQVLYRHLKKRLKAALKQIPENCLYNRQPCEYPRMIPHDLPRVCIHAERVGALCDKSHDNSLKYQDCPFFTPAKSDGDIRKEFVELAKQPRDRVAEHMPDAAALMWVLDQEQGVPQGEAESASNGEAGDGEDDEEPAPEPPDPEVAPEEMALAVPEEVLLPAPWWHVHRWGVWGWRGWPWNWRQPQTCPADDE